MFAFLVLKWKDAMHDSASLSDADLWGKVKKKHILGLVIRIFFHFSFIALSELNYWGFEGNKSVSCYIVFLSS